MANYSLILDTKFKPFSYQEMVAPVIAATQAHQAIEEEYGNLSAKASVFENMANKQTDPYAYKMYKTYSDDLSARADELMKYGLNASSRKGMLDMRARYSKEILPIETAYKRREALAEEQRKAMAANPTMLYQRYARNMSLDDFIKNPSLDYGSQYSGALLTQQVAQAAANIAKEARDSEEGKRKLRQIVPYQYEMVQQNGFSREAVMKAILNSPDADSILTGLVESAIGTSGVKNWGDADTVRRAYDYARQGLYHAIGTTQYQMVADQFGMQSALQNQAHRHRMAEAREAGRAQAAAMAQQQSKARMWAFKDNKLAGEKGSRSNQFQKYHKYGFVRQDGHLTVTGARNSKLGSRIANYIYQAEHAKTPAERNKYATLAYRAAYGKDPVYTSTGYYGPLASGDIHPNNIGKRGLTTAEIIGAAKSSSQYQFYTDLRSSGITRRSIETGWWSRNNLDKVQTAYSTNVGNPVVGQLTHTLNNESGKELMVSVASELGNQNVYGVKVNNKGEVVSNNKGVKLSSFVKDGESKVFIKHFSLVPTSPGTAILTLSNGQRVMLTRAQMNQAFGTSITDALITNSKLYASGNSNESALGLANLNEIMGTATTQWGSPSASGTGQIDLPWDYGY